MLLLTIYLLLSLLVGFVARERAIGFIGFFVLSLLFTPVIMFLVYLLGAPARRAG